MPDKLNGESTFDLDQPVSTFSPGERESNDLCETNGQRANRNRVYNVQIDSESLYDLLDLLRRLAVEHQTYQIVSRAVTYERMLYRQAREQGF
jgi:hypothetical protein